jgi:hypothetical protein
MTLEVEKELSSNILLREDDIPHRGQYQEGF